MSGLDHGISTVLDLLPAGCTRSFAAGKMVVRRSGQVVRLASLRRMRIRSPNRRTNLRRSPASRPIDTGSAARRLVPTSDLEESA